ncbi:MAG: ribosome recycling factor [Candidatus Wildermuthbacteria bacterium]|nr:ribosome recycling factor [Candidatus Wildermuthbacteria bacterium]MBI2121075.1 ribosome recycling factor [Candidatus Wildermuthbacteria bacterium]MBI2647864.1 ribosome recycling factor [Candidatus Wildermuthbacteria bacterium]
MIKEILTHTKGECAKAVDFFTKELMRLRTGQANPGLVEDIPVALHGEMLPLKHIAGITCPERRQILIQPWDASALGSIEKALQKAALGAQPVVDQTSVRLILPSITQEYRDMLIKNLTEKAEQTKKSIRRHREEAWERVQTMTREGTIREDDKFRAKDELQNIIDEAQEAIERLVERKKGELGT